MKILVGKDTGSYTFDASAQTVTFAGLGTININQIILITNSTDQKIIYNFASSALGGTLSGSVLTLAYDTTAMDDADDLQILFEIGEPQIDFSLSVLKNITQNPIWNRYTDAETLVTAQVLTATQDNVGAEIDMRGYTHLGMFIFQDVNDSENVDLVIKGSYASGGTLHNINSSTPSTISLWTTLASDSYEYHEFDIGVLPFVQLQAIAGTVGVTPGELTIVIVKYYRP